MRASRNKSICTSCTPEFQIERTRDIILPYYREAINFLPSGPPMSNYTTYHLFCLRKNIIPYIHRINRAYDVNFISRLAGLNKEGESAKNNNEEVLSIIMQIYHGGNVVSLTEEDHKRIEKYVNAVIDNYPNVPIYDYSLESKYPKEWVYQILPAYKGPAHYIDGKLYVNLEGMNGYSEEWEKM